MQDVQAAEDSGSLRASSRADRAIHTHAKVTSVTRQMCPPHHHRTLPPPPSSPSHSRPSGPCFLGTRGCRLTSQVPVPTAAQSALPMEQPTRMWGKGQLFPLRAAIRWPLGSGPCTAQGGPLSAHQTQQQLSPNSRQQGSGGGEQPWPLGAPLLPFPPPSPICRILPFRPR